MFQSLVYIDPTNMSPDENRYLGRLLLQVYAENGQAYFPAGLSTLEIKTPHGGQIIRLDLAHPIVMRTRENNPDQVRLEVIGKEIGKGAFSHVYKVQHTLIPQSDGSLKVKKKKRILKQQLEKPKTVVTAKNEYTQAALTPHLHMKRPVYAITSEGNTSFLIGSLMSGTSLETFLKREAKSRNFSLDDRLRLSVELINALQTQVHAQGIVHRDIKPDNIMVDFNRGVTSHAYIIDYGLSKPSTLHENIKCGTMRYFAPEVWRSENATEKSDIYSLGVVLGRLWGAQILHDVTYESTLHRVFHGLFTNIQGLSPQQQDMIKFLLSCMCAPSPEMRGTLAEAAEIFNEIRYEVSGITQEQKSREMLTKVHIGAKHLGEQITQYCKQQGDKWNINVIRREVEKALLQFPDERLYVREFIIGLGIRAFDDYADKESILQRLNNMTADFVFAREDLSISMNILHGMMTKEPKGVTTEYMDYLRHVIKNAQRRNLLVPRSVDELAEVTKKIQNDIKVIKSEIEFLHQAAKQQIEPQVIVRPLVSARLSLSQQTLFAPPQRHVELLPKADGWGPPLKSLW